MGWPLAQVGALSEAEFQLWQSRGKPLWPRRLELLLAQLTAVLAQVNGNKHTLHDMDLFDPQAEQRAALSEAAEALADMAVAGVRRLGQGRKKKGD